MPSECSTAAEPLSPPADCDSSGRSGPFAIPAASRDTEARVDRDGNDFILDASLIGELLGIEPGEVPALMRNRHITSICESGVDADSGTFRINLFYRGRHGRLRLDAAGRILHRSVIDFGERPRRQRKNAMPSADGDARDPASFSRNRACSERGDGRTRGPRMELKA